MELCLDADEAGEKATKELQTFFTQAEDVREFSEYTRAGEERRILMKGWWLTKV